MDEQPQNEINLEELQKQSEEYLAGWKRAQADYQNLKKESEREKSDFAKFANERLLSDLLPAIDQFSLALSFIPDTSTLSPEDKKKWDNWLIGIKAVQSLWDQAAQNAGLTRISVAGAFDPTLHDAVGTEEVEGSESGSIIRVAEDGWSLHGKVLRPAKVIISK